MAAEKISESEALLRRMMAMAARDEENEAAGIVEEVEFPQAPGGPLYARKAKTGALTSSIRIPKNSIGALLGIKGCKFQRLQTAPGVVSMEFDKASCQLTYTTSNPDYQKLVASIIDLTLDKSWPDNESEDEEEIEALAKGKSDYLPGIYRSRISLEKKHLGSILPELNPLSNTRGVIRILMQPREEQSKTHFELLVDSFTEKGLREVMESLQSITGGKSYSRPDSVPQLAPKPAEPSSEDDE